ncbi:hypothetical protein RI129_009421 [Pyrocoelia pectoralis]|uniref:oxaloacetate tautomerase n=1 Tax=Pyrocoelia pectoralis TaxID=417401 RepID=A0AAN7VBL4_9COLE
MSVSTLEDFVKNCRNIYGAAFNYMYPSSDPFKRVEEPELFLKAPTDFITEGQSIKIPNGFTVIEEVTLGVIIGNICKKVNVEDALDYVGGYCVAFDMTAINELQKNISQKVPWTTSKSFDTSCPVSGFITKEAIPDPNNVELFATINGKLQQNGSTSELRFTAAELISFISQQHTLEPNDVILIGTPPVAGTVRAGDAIIGGIKGGVTIKFDVKDD